MCISVRSFRSWLPMSRFIDEWIPGISAPKKCSVCREIPFLFYQCTTGELWESDNVWHCIKCMIKCIIFLDKGKSLRVAIWEDCFRYHWHVGLIWGRKHPIFMNDITLHSGCLYMPIDQVSLAPDELSGRCVTEHVSWQQLNAVMCNHM